MQNAKLSDPLSGQGALSGEGLPLLAAWMELGKVETAVTAAAAERNSLLFSDILGWSSKVLSEIGANRDEFEGRPLRVMSMGQMMTRLANEGTTIDGLPRYSPLSVLVRRGPGMPGPYKIPGLAGVVGDDMPGPYEGRDDFKSVNDINWVLSAGTGSVGSRNRQNTTPSSRPAASSQLGWPGSS